MLTLETIQSKDNSTIVIAACVFSGIMFGIYKRQGIMITALYGVLFGAGGLAINSILKIK